jgi:hypothetical protein
MPSNSETLEVFQDLYIAGSDEALAAFVTRITDQLVPPWTRVLDDERQLARGIGSETTMIFRREPDAATPGAKLFLWCRSPAYEVSNIIPLVTGELGRGGYNTVLQDFIVRVAEPAAAPSGVTLKTSASRQTLDDWVGPEAAHALRLFSSMANKSTGSGHPLDRERWFAFIAKAYAEDDRLDTSRLVRWLVEVEHWPDDEASDLAIEYEFGLGLLDYIKG